MNKSRLHKAEPQRFAYQRIADDLRRQIVQGELLPGTQLPATKDLSATLKSNYFTVHTALMSLVKEGWIERIHGYGTYVAYPENRFTCAGIYHANNIWCDEESIFQRRLHVSLLDKFAKLKKSTLVFVDSRPENKQGSVLPALADAILHRQIQCLVAPNVNSRDLPALRRLKIATAFITTESLPNRVDFDENVLLRESMERLAAQGCRSVGIISNNPPEVEGDPNYPIYYQNFRNEAKAAGLKTNKHWVRMPNTFYCSELANFGYLEFQKLWKLREKPEGLIVYPDTVARGVITAVLKSGVRVPEQMKFVIHRNLGTNVLCPFPVTWAISDESAVADELIRLIQKQFAGETVFSSIVPYTFEYDDARAWLS